jgi:hypothetical protein
MKQQAFDTPILFLIFNRPDETRRVFSQIKKIKPKFLYIVADGPRNKNEEKLCEKTRLLVINNINWKCEVKTLFRRKNLGCGVAIHQAINWFFKEVDRGIILEDDCYPDLSFFYFCQKMLNKYEDIDHVMHISGSQFLPSTAFKNSYQFSSYPSIWGWATWKRAWKKYDFKIYENEEVHKFKLQKENAFSLSEVCLRFLQLKLLKKHFIDTWDYQWYFSIMLEKGITIRPRKNLTKNIGLVGTHILKPDRRFLVPRQKISFPLRHPTATSRNKKEDKRYSMAFLQKNIFKIIGQLCFLSLK